MRHPPDTARASGPLGHPDTPPDLAAAGLAALDGTATPLGVAAMWAALLGTAGRYETDDVGSVGDDWVARHGPVFAARIAAEFAGLSVVALHRRPSDSGPLALVRTPDRCGDGADHIAARVLAQVRAALAAAPAVVYAEALTALCQAREGSTSARIATSFLAPTETQWVDADAAGFPAGHLHASLLMASVSTVEQAAAIVPRLSRAGWWHLHEPAMLHTLAEGLGDGILDVFADDWAGRSGYDGGFSLTQFLLDLADALAALPTDRAFQALLDRAARPGVPAAVVVAAGRFPVRAMRLMDASAGRPRVGDLLRRHAARFADLAPERLRVANRPSAGVAPVEALPAVLGAPPWATRPKASRAIVLAGLRCTDPPEIVWRPGEEERYAARLAGKPVEWKDYPGYAERLASGTAEAWEMRWLLLEGPEELGRAALAGYRPGEAWRDARSLATAAVRFGVDVLPPLVDCLHQRPADGELLMPFVSPEVALLMADWHARLRNARRTALAWLRAHPAPAARALVPAALGKAGPQRRAAEQALVMLAGAGQRAAVVEAAGGYGPAALEAIAELLDTDPLVRHLPARIPEPPAWAGPALLPPVRLRGGGGTLPGDAVRHLLTMLMMSRLGEPYAGVAHVRAACEEHDLARLGWELLQRWDEAGAPPADAWALDAQALLGDDETAAGLAESVQRWSQEEAHKRATSGLDVLAALGTGAALRQLRDIATRVRATALRTRAERHLAAVAETLGLTADQLADRLVPDFELAPDATTRLDYGARWFVGGFDEQLRPYVAEEDGTRRKDLPEPSARDDERLAAAARKRFAAAKTGVRKIAAEQVRRLEQAMVTGRRWSAAEFRAVLLEHPLLWLLARRLVWMTGGAPGGSGRALRVAANHGLAAGDAPGRGGMALRVAEDRSLVDVDGRKVRLADDAVVRVAHPVELDVAAWVEVFEDNGLVQPFQQLKRVVERLGDEERAAVRLARFDGQKALSVKVVGLERRGWRREGRRGGYQGRMEREVPGGARVVVCLEPGILLGSPGHHPEQEFSDVWVCPAGGESWGDERGVRLGDLDPVSASELLRDLGSCL
ncbi:hypothetical protein GCM10022255_036420 [Dactylosporangium darangshiense]|uniref:DUF4132 domain-containing protein n=1 Tax=Dactylosporangium darangshiense TaxID=579108 RepID=A0ABP8D8I4_9ACTN